MGTERHIKAATLHCTTVPRKNIIVTPIITETPAKAVSIPRIDGSHISPTYVTMGASINPTPNPSNTTAMKTSCNVVAK